ncbi:MAG: class I SAM-dependent methyltransferase [Methanomicrobiales archaeon]|nr:class I SAM-dependent methyltransferase [Methanomicrobiales archaeon]
MTKLTESNPSFVDTEFDFTSVFNAEDYLYFYEQHLKPEYTKEEIQFLIRELLLEKPEKILDLACGYGRHANYLARFGHIVTGVDNNQDFLDIAGKGAKDSGVDVRYICEDSRKFSSPGEYDCIIHLFSSFGYFPDEENELVIRNIAVSLNPGGRFCLDILNRDAFVNDFPQYSVLEKNGDFMIDQNRFEPLSGRLYNSRIIIRDGKRKDTPFFLRLYNPTEIISLLKQEGLVLKKVYGNWDSKPFDSTSKRMILIAEKQ